MGLMKRNNKIENNPKSQYLQKYKIIRALDAPFDYVEAYKSLRTNLNFISSASGIKSILITSAVPSESKSTVAINLAITLADNGSSVIVVECDLRKPELCKYLRVTSKGNGLSSVLAGNISLEESIINVEKFGISVLLGGTVPPNPSELLNNIRMQELIQTLKQKYDYVILDAPPVAVVTDAAVVGRMADGAILVVRSRFAPVKTIRLAKQRLEAVNIKVLGAVITHFNAKATQWRSGYNNYKGYEYNYANDKNHSE